MKTVLLLLKKDRQIFLSENFNGKRRHDVFGALSTIILLALLYGARLSTCFTTLQGFTCPQRLKCKAPKGPVPLN